MPFIPIPNCVQVNLRLTLLGQEVENVLNFRAPGNPTAADLAACAEGVAAWWQTGIRSQVHSGAVFRETYAVDMSSQNGAVHTYAGGSGLAGTNPGNPSPNSIALCITLRTAFRGRSYRGRIYHMGLTENEVVNNEVLAAHVTTLSGIYADLLQAQNFGGCELGVASRYLNKAPRLVGVITPVTTTLIQDPVVDSQRRRLPGRGR